MCAGHSATTDNDHHTADNQLSRCCKLHADWSVRNVTEYDSLLVITRSLCGHAIIEIGASARLGASSTCSLLAEFYTFLCKRRINKSL